MANDDDTRTLPAIISCAEAFARGLKRFFTGEPCVHGHIAERMVTGLTCTACSRERYEKGAEVKKAKVRAYRARHPEAVRESHARYRAENREALVERQLAWKAAHREAVRGWDRNRRSKRRGAEGSHTGEDIRRIYRAQKGKCAICRVKVGEDYHVDHILPLALGGSNWARNLQILCPTCNCSKNARDPVEFMRSRGLLL